MNACRRPAAVAAGILLSLLVACTPDGPDQYLASARDYMARSDYSAASIQARNAVKSRPDSAEARLLLGHALMKANDPRGAESEFRRALELGQPRDDVLAPLARAMLMAGRAEVLVREFADRPPAGPAARAEFLAALGDAYTTLARRDDASRAFRDALAARPGHASARLGLAQLEAQSGRLDEALAETNGVIAADPKNAQAFALKSDVLFARRDRAGAREALEQAVRADPNYLPARYALVSTLIDDGAFETARDHLATLAKLAPGDGRLVYFQSALALRSGDLSAARERASALLKVAPDHAPALVLMARIETQAKQFASAEAHLRRVLAATPEHQEARRLLVSNYLRSGQSERAQQELKPLLAAPDPQVLLLAGETSLARGDAKQAAAYYQQAAARGQKSEAAAAHTRLGQLAMAAGQPEEGVRELENAASADPAYRQTDLALVSGYMRRGEVDKALAAARALEKKNPKDPQSHQVLGMVHVARNDPGAARASFEKALQLNPAFVPAARALAELDLADRKPDAARRRYEAMIAKDPRNATLQLALVELNLRSGAQPADVLPALRSAVAADPSSVDARLALITGLSRSGDARAALLAAQEAHAAHPASVPVMQLLATFQAEAGDRQQSLETLRKIAQANPGRAAPLQQVAAVQAARKQHDRAVETLRLAREVAPNDHAVSRDLIVAYLNTGRPEEAIKEARAVQTAAPASSAGWLLESQVHESQKQFDEAEKSLRQALKVEPGSGLLAARLHGVMLAGGRKAEAEAFARKWLADHPKDTVLRSSLGDREMAAQNFKGATAHYQAVLAVDPNNVVALNNLAWAAGRTNDPKALEYAERAAKLAPGNAAVLDTLGTLLVAKGEAPRGAEVLSRAVRLAPARADIRLNHAKALIEAGRKAEARRELEVVAAHPNEFPGKAEAARLLGSL